MKAKTLVQAWLEVELIINGKTLVATLKELNKALGTAHTHSRVREWETNRNGRGDRLPRRIRVYMAKKVIRHILTESGLNAKKLTTRQINRLVDRMC